MTKVSTAALLIGQASVGPWGDDAWRLGFTAQLVEGGGGGPYWLVSPPAEGGQRSFPPAIVIDGLDERQVFRSILVLLASIATDGDASSWYRSATGGLAAEEGGTLLQRQPRLFDVALEKRLSASLTEEFRVGVVLLDEPTVMSSEVVDRLVARGFRTQVFRADGPTGDMVRGPSQRP